MIRRFPEESEFKTHAAEPFGRDGDWSILKKMVAALHNVEAASFASQFEAESEHSQYTLFLSPTEALERHEEEQAEEEFRDREFGRLLEMFE